MGTPLKAFDLDPQESVKSQNVIQLIPSQSVIEPVDTVYTSVLNSFKFSTNKKDHKLLDYLMIGFFSILVHHQIINNFKGFTFQQELVEPEKQPPKVTITFSRPQPKPVPPPPVVKPAPPPVQKVVPLKPPKPKPQPKIQPEVVEQTPVIENAVVSNDAPPAPPAPPAPVVEEKITLPVASGDYLHNPPPEYPSIAADRGWVGKVILRVHVLVDGKAGAVKIQKSSGYKVLDEAAAEAVSKWSFSPAKRGDTPIDFWYDVPINFV